MLKVLAKTDTPKKEGPTKTWNEDSLNSALDALRTGTISANKASKAFGIPSSTLYKIARREGIRLAAPFNAAPTSWSAEDLEKALEGELEVEVTLHDLVTDYFFYLQLFVLVPRQFRRQALSLEFLQVSFSLLRLEK